MTTAVYWDQQASAGSTSRTGWSTPPPTRHSDRGSGCCGPEACCCVEGRWWTGGGLSAAETTELVLLRGRQATVVPLDDLAPGGGPVDGERHLLTSHC